MRAAVIICALAAGAVQAEDADVVVLHTRFLAEPTEWCPADKGVPAIETMDGPNVEGFLKPGRNSEVRVRRGAAVGTVEEDTSYEALQRTQSPAVSGRFYARTQTCVSFYGSDGSGTWEIRDGDTVLAESDFDARDIRTAEMSRFRSPIPHFAYNRAYFFETDDGIVFFGPSFVEVQSATEAFVSPAEEQDQ